jgi:flagellar hook-associated protein 3 FlgL
MSSLPISISRVSDPLKNLRLLSQLNADQVALQRSFDQMSTGLRVSKVSDDPAAAGRAITLQRGISRTEQLSRNANVTRSFYAATDQALSTLGDLLIDTRGITVEAAQNVLTSDEREALAATIDQAVRTAVSSANSVFRDHQLLGGHLQAENALAFQDAYVVFKGNETVGQTITSGYSPIAIGVSGTDSFGLASPIVSGPSLQPAIYSNTSLSDLRQGLGVSNGVIRVSDGGDWIELDLRTASTVGDVVESLQGVDFDGRALDVTLTADGITIDFADGLGGSLVIDDLPGSTMAADLAIRNVSGLSPTPIVATKLSPRLSLTTPLSQLAGGAGINVSDGIQIRRGADTFTIDLSTAQSIGDVLVAINRSGADVRAEIDPSGQGILVRGLASGADYSIGENGGSAARQLGIRSADRDVSLDELNGGLGVRLSQLGPDLIIERTDGGTLSFQLEGVRTVGQVIDMINNHLGNQAVPRVTASLNRFGNGITLTSPASSQLLSVSVGSTSDAAQALGLVPQGQTQALGTSSGGTVSLVGSDYAPRHPGGAIDTLIRLAAAVREGNPAVIEQLQQQLDADTETVRQVRGRVGLWTQDLDRMQEVADDTVIDLKAQLSEEVDADIAQVVTDITARQTSQEASLRLIAQSARMSLLDFL